MASQGGPGERGDGRKARLGPKYLEGFSVFSGRLITTAYCLVVQGVEVKKGLTGLR